MSKSPSKATTAAPAKSAAAKAPTRPAAAAAKVKAAPARSVEVVRTPAPHGIHPDHHDHYHAAKEATAIKLARIRGHEDAHKEAHAGMKFERTGHVEIGGHKVEKPDHMKAARKPTKGK